MSDARPKNAGYSLAEVMIAIGILAAVLTGFVTLFLSLQGSMTKSLTHSLNSFQLQGVMSNIRTAVLDDSSWMSTVKHADNIGITGGKDTKCLRDNTNCHGKGGPLKIVDAAGGVVFDSLSDGNGISAIGNPCTTFDRTNGNTLCPLRFDVSWTPVCAGNPCNQPLVKVKVDLIYKPGTGTVNDTKYNPARYSYELLRSWVTVAPTPTPTPSGPCPLAKGTVLNKILTHGQPGACGYSTTVAYCTITTETEFLPGCHSVHQIVGTCTYGTDCPNWVTATEPTCDPGGQRMGGCP